MGRTDGQLISTREDPLAAAPFAVCMMEVRAMDGKGLVQFALMGNGHLEQYAILLVRVSIGLFFAISGANKLFVAGGTKPVYDTLVQAKIPFPHFTAYFVSAVDVLFGSFVACGFFFCFGMLALWMYVFLLYLSS